ncbi:MAG: hypothetical protein LBO71_01900 [Prevotellaceae bacterium]|jgi:hypothetical protein|nr:hypothetical protein [Prevotellaceae bacterium]
MKKSLIGMALMFGAVVFVMPSCGGDDKKEETKATCTVKVVKQDGSKINSVVYLTPVEKGKEPTGAVEGADATTDNKGATYICE